MDWSATNGQNIAEWSDRTLPTDFSQSRGRVRTVAVSSINDASPEGTATCLSRYTASHWRDTSRPLSLAHVVLYNFLFLLFGRQTFSYDINTLLFLSVHLFALYWEIDTLVLIVLVIRCFALFFLSRWRPAVHGYKVGGQGGDDCATRACHGANSVVCWHGGVSDDGRDGLRAVSL